MQESAGEAQPVAAKPHDGPPRQEWVDVAKGLGILLVVLGHTSRGVTSAGLAHDAGFLGQADRVIYAFHMPLFFWLSGLLATKRLHRPFASFLGTQLRSIAYPYLVWSCLQTTIQILLSSMTNNSLGWDALLRIPVDPPMQFWFLYALFVDALLYRALTGVLRPPAAAGLCILLGLASAWLPNATWSVAKTALHFLPFYAIGTLMLQVSSRSLASLARTPSLLLAVACFALMGVTLSLGLPSPGTVAKVFLLERGLAPGLLGSLGIVLLGHGLPAASRRVLGDWGKVSLQIYVAHTLASAATRIALARLGIDDLSLHLLLGTVAGMALPILLDRTLRKLDIGYVFSWPRRETSEGSPRAPSS